MHSNIHTHVTEVQKREGSAGRERMMIAVVVPRTIFERIPHSSLDVRIQENGVNDGDA